jgi:hypothetical protein
MTWAKALPMPMWSSSSCLADDDYVATLFTYLEASSMSSCVLVFVVVRLLFLLFFSPLVAGTFHPYSWACAVVNKCVTLTGRFGPLYIKI